MRRRRSLSFYCLLVISIVAIWTSINQLMNVDWTSPHIRAIREKIFPPEESWFDITRDCENFRKVRKYFAQPLSAEEKAFPIAYVITIHHDLQSFELLLRSTYHPQNLYCVHPDLKAEEKFHSGVKAIANCFDNVFIASSLEGVQYTHMSRVQADLNCMKDLVNRSPRHGWRYVINLCGQDFPLKTNLEMVRHLKGLVGYNNMETFHTPAHKKRRFQFHFDLPKHGGYSVMERTGVRKEPPPGDVEIYSGSAYYAFKRRAVEYFLNDPLVQNLFNWSQDAYSPDEYIWATVQRMYPRLPGSFPPDQKYDLNELTSVTRLVKWAGLDGKVYPKCGGAYRHGICVYGVSDLTWLLSHKHFFANKFDQRVDLFAVECLDAWIRNKTLMQRSIYSKQGFI